MRSLLQKLIRLYQWFPLRPVGYCRFVPTCSQYCYEALGEHGTIKGMFLCAKRILRCNPWTKK